MNLPKEITKVLTSLQDAGYEAYCVGGCVRDYILHQECKDYDITTNASIDEIKRIFESYSNFNLGKKHSTVTIHIGDHFVEITPFKGKTLEEDLQHRDLTINAIAYSLEYGITDIVGGLRDIKRKQIRFVKTAYERIQEDPIRMLRLIRFALKYDFKIVQDSYQNINNNAYLLNTVAKERIRDELSKILAISEKGIAMMHELGLLEVVCPELDRMFECDQNNPHHYTNVGRHTLDALKASYSISHYFDESTNNCIRMALLFHDVGKSICKSTDEKGIDHFYVHAEHSVLISSKFMAEHKFSNHEKALIEFLIKHHDYPFSTKLKSIRKILRKHKIYPENMKRLLAVQYCDKCAQNFKEEKISKLLEFNKVYFDVVERRPYRIDQLAINGKEILEAISGLDSKKIPEVQKFCLDIVFQHPEKNIKEYLIDVLHRKRDWFTGDFKLGEDK